MTTTRKKFRFEKKYLIDTAAAHFLKQRVSYVLSPDMSSPDGCYRVSSLYFDDMYGSSVYQKQDGILVRDKFRVRFYNGDHKLLRLERKHKHGEMICKQSALITPGQYQMMREGDHAFMAGQGAPVFETFYAAHLARHMRPAVMVDYDRAAYVHPAGNVRVTFDTGLSAGAPGAEHSFSAAAAVKGRTIVEIKYDRFIPSFIADLFTGFRFTQQLALSKFIMAKFALQGV